MSFRGPQVFFPSFVFTMVRSGKPRATNEVVFRVPRILNKFDIKQYLEKLYGVEVTEVRTANFLSKTTNMRKRYIPCRKNAIVSLKVPFKYPPPTELSLLNYPLPNPNLHRKLH